MSKLASGKFRDFPVGYRPVRVEWKDLDKCNVCHMDEVNFVSSSCLGFCRLMVLCVLLLVVPHLIVLSIDLN